jgi:hypothetical protein
MPEPVFHHCNVINASPKKMNIHDLDWPSLQKDFLSKENSMKRLIFANSFLKSGKDLIKREWAEKMVEA